MHDTVDACIAALEAKVDGLDKTTEVRLVALDRKIDLTRALLVAQMKTLETIVTANPASLTHALDIDRRLERIESNHASTKVLERAS